MKAILKSIWVDSADFDFDSYKPNELNKFSLWLQLKIGFDSVDESDNFQLHVCTPDWIKENIPNHQWGRHMLIIQLYNRECIKAEIEHLINLCSCSSWSETSQKLSRFFAWEYEDYSS